MNDLEHCRELYSGEEDESYWRKLWRKPSFKKIQWEHVYSITFLEEIEVPADFKIKKASVKVQNDSEPELILESTDGRVLNFHSVTYDEFGCMYSLGGSNLPNVSDLKKFPNIFDRIVNRFLLCIRGIPMSGKENVGFLESFDICMNGEIKTPDSFRLYDDEWKEIIEVS